MAKRQRSKCKICREPTPPDRIRPKPLRSPHLEKPTSATRQTSSSKHSAGEAITVQHVARGGVCARLQSSLAHRGSKALIFS